MKRKLIQHGMSSLTVSLPRKFVKENNLKKGEEIDLETQGTRAVISTKKHHEKKKVVLDVSNSQPMLRKIIGAAFKSGYDEIEIHFSSFEELKAVQELIREQFTGFEIINQTKNTLIIKNLSETSFEEFPNVLRRFFLVLNQISEETAQAAEKNDSNWLRSIALMKTESDKFADYTRRAINMGADIEFKRNAPLYIIIEQLEKAVDRYCDICIYTSENKLHLSKEMISFIKDLFEFETLFYKTFYKFEMKNIIEFGKLKNQLQHKIEKIKENCSKKELRVAVLSERILNTIFDLNGPLMAVNI